jgi:putative PIG3 family NAD(P)H quinone oxidoreductase
LIEVLAAGLNRADILQRRGLYPSKPGSSTILGLECSGTVVDTGDGVDPALVGSKVCAVVDGGAYGEFCVADVELLLPLQGSDFQASAAAVPEALATTWLNLISRDTAHLGDWLLIQGGTSGIGTTAIQVAKTMGCRIIATASTAPKRALCLALGADHALDYRSEDFVEEVMQLTRGRGVASVLDNVGPANLDTHAQVVHEYADIVMIGSQGGRTGSFNIGPLMAKQVRIHATSLRRMPKARRANLFEDIRRRAWPMVENGLIRPLVDSTFHLADAALAHERLEDPGHVGKILLTAGELVRDSFGGIHALSPLLHKEATS